MRKAIVVSSAVVLTLMLVAPMTTAGATTVEVPFRAAFSGGASHIEWAPGIELDPSAKSTFGGRCSVPSSWVITNTGSGRATYLGRFTWTSVHCTQAGATPAEPITISDGQMTYVVANGDVLMTEYGQGSVSSFTPTWMCIDTTATFVGGEGRFEDASGSTVEHGCFDPQHPLLEVVVFVASVGTISFDRSDAAG